MPTIDVNKPIFFESSRAIRLPAKIRAKITPTMAPEQLLAERRPIIPPEQKEGDIEAIIKEIKSRL